MAFYRFELLATCTRHVDDLGEVQWLKRLTAHRWGNGTHAQLEILAPAWDSRTSPPSLAWSCRRLSPPPEKVWRLAELVGSVWGAGREPRLRFPPTADTAFTGLVLNVALDERHGSLWAVPLHEMEGEDSAAVGAVLQAIDDLAEPC